jgi:hypothetical protein
MSKGMRDKKLDAANNGTALVPPSSLRAKLPSLLILGHPFPRSISTAAIAMGPLGR